MAFLLLTGEGAMWQAIQYVGTGLSLVAFIAAAVAFAYAKRSGDRARLIETAKPEDRAELIRSALEFFHVDTGNLTKEKQFQVALEQIRARANRFNVTAIAVCVLALAFMALAAYAISRSTSSPKEVIGAVDDVRVDLWRGRRTIDSVSGSAWIVVDLSAASKPDELSNWLGRVEQRYAEIQAASSSLDDGALITGGGALAKGTIDVDMRGDVYLDIDPFSSPKKNWDLAPEGGKERFADELLFNTRFIMLATGGGKRGLLMSPMSFEAKATSVKVYFDTKTKKPIRIEGHVEGAGKFTAVTGQFGDWMDFYGGYLIARQTFSVYAYKRYDPNDLENPPELHDLELVNYENINFHVENRQWSPSATFAESTGAELFTDDQHSLVVQKADWRTLGQVPRDYPGTRIDLHGPEPKAW